MILRSRGIKTSVQQTVVVAGRRTAEEVKMFAGEVADAAAAAAATAKAVAGVVLDRVATAMEKKSAKGPITIAAKGTTPNVAVGDSGPGAKKKATKKVASKKTTTPKKKVAPNKTGRKPTGKKRV